MRHSVPIFIRLLLVLPTLWLATLMHSDVAAQTPDEATHTINITTYKQDVATFKRLRGNLLQLKNEAKQRSDLFGPKAADDVTLLRPEMREQILSIWYPVLDNYLALDAMSEAHMVFHQFKKRDDRRLAFHLAHGIFLAQYRIALELIALFESNPIVDTILNEAAPPLGLPQGVYTQFKYQYLNVIKAGRYAALEAVAHAYKADQDPQLAQMAAADSQIILTAGKGPGPLMTVKNGLAIIKRAGQTTWFPVQKGVAEWMGHTKVWRRHQYLIRPEQITRLSHQLEPGDIFLERREWYLTNVGIPGFWTHAALFVGSVDQRKSLSDDPQVKAWLELQGAESLDELIRKRYPRAYAGMLTPYKDGRRPQVIEAISPGVSFTSLHYSATCDSLAVLRPRLSKADRAAAVVRAMRYYGRPYDYAFDFSSDTSLVCTELIFKSYLPGKTKKGLALPLERLMGQMITPANAFVRQFDNAYDTPEQQMDLVLFLDGIEKEGCASLSTKEAFRESWKRPKWHILIQSVKTNEQ